MRLMTFDTGGSRHVGALTNDHGRVLSLTSAAPAEASFRSMRDLIAAGDEGLDHARTLLVDQPADSVYSLSDVVVRAPIPDPPRIRDCCLFIEHLEPAFRALARQEAAGEKDPETAYERLIGSGRFDVPQVLRDRVIYYNADHLCVSGPEDVIVCPPGSRHLDYELEFGAVLGPSRSDLDRTAAHQAIFGYLIYNDWSCRDTQALVMQSHLGPAEGKDFDGSTTLGPCIVTRDSLPDPYSLDMVARVNGVQWSSGNSSTMQHTFEDAIIQFSRGKTLYPGDVLGSGTVLSGSGLEVGKRLADGDIVELEVEGIGLLSNRVRIPAS